VVVTASGTLSDGSTYDFNPAVSRQRAALLLSNDTVYAGFASFCDYAADQSRGWVLGWQAGTLAPLASNELTNKRSTAPDTFYLSSIWMSGYGLAANAAGSVYFVTGNSDYSGNTYNSVTNIAESAAAMSPDLSTVRGLFTPSNHAYLDRVDGDYGSGGLMLLPPQSGNHPNLAAAAGKDGNLYLLDADKMTMLGAYQIGACWCGPSYCQGSNGAGRIVSSGNTAIGVWELKGKKPKLVLKKQADGIADGQFPGFFLPASRRTAQHREQPLYGRWEGPQTAIRPMSIFTPSTPTAGICSSTALPGNGRIRVAIRTLFRLSPMAASLSLQTRC
jgi:hypothetical protein